MTKSVYIVGGAGSGKSTFMGNLLNSLGWIQPQIDLHALRNAKALVTLRGHEIAGGIYLGKMRDEHPGTDGLDRASHRTGIDWLARGLHSDYDFIIGEGFTLGTRDFLAALGEHTDLLLVHISVGEEERLRRFAERGTSQNPQFVKSTVSASRNRYEELLGHVKTLDVNGASAYDIDVALDICEEHLK